MSELQENEGRELAKFLVIVQKGIRKHGIKRIVKSIQSIDFEENSAYHQEILDYIFKVVCEEFVITKDDILRREKRGVVTVARKIAIVISKQTLGISDENLAHQFKRERQLIYYAIKDYEKLDRENKLDKRFFERYDSVNEKVVKYIEELKK